jgi:hypothetical protein
MSQTNSGANSGGSQPPPPRKSEPLEAQLIPVPGSATFRPPRADVPLPTPKPSAAPAPRLRPSAPATRGDAPTPSADLQATDQLADMVAAQRSSFLQHPTAPAAHSKILTTAGDPRFFRKTIIPILLTFAVILAGWAVLILTAGEDNALGDLFPHWTPIALLVLASLFFLLGVFNMLAVRKEAGNPPR